ncbi:MAG TPA: deoxyribodipyrimidine photo-lyase [Acetobacteraceae bacterium]|nr:deoxyribodipyrimidine photo-lyase [Acetobacteraceae bacterium]
MAPSPRALVSGVGTATYGGMASTPRIAVLWFRRDLRLLDNPALHAALRGAERIVPLFVLPEPLPPELGAAARWWLHGSLLSLREDLAARGAALVLRRGDPARVVAEILAESGAQSVHACLCPEPAWRAADAALLESNCRLELYRSLTLFDPEAVKTRDGGIYGMYTPYANTVRGLPPPATPLPIPETIPVPKKLPAGDRLEDWKLLPKHPDWAGGLRTSWTAGETRARERGRAFLRGAARQYDTGRNIPGRDLTSRLSPHLRFGELSPRSLWHAIYRHEPGAGESVFAGELIWRDFAAYLLWHHPDLPDKPLRAEYEALPWRDSKSDLRAWQKGETGVPIVDAGMRQLWQTGWMHNRVRMIVGSFLTKHLLIDWRRGAAWFLDTLVDADLAANSMNWQWVAGTGIDSQPFFRVFNPVTQGQRFDADGAYVRSFVPEIARLPDKFLHAPWTAPAAILRDAGIKLGETYRTPIIDLAAGRERALATWKNTVQEKTARTGT